MPGHCLPYENSDEVAAKKEKMVEYITRIVLDSSFESVEFVYWFLKERDR